MKNTDSSQFIIIVIGVERFFTPPQAKKTPAHLPFVSGGFHCFLIILLLISVEMTTAREQSSQQVS